MSETHETKFMFKGTRKYVHGTDIYRSLITIKPQIKEIKLKFVAPLYSQGEWIIVDKHSNEYGNDEFKQAVVKATISTHDWQYRCYLIAKEDNLVTSKYEYAEENLKNYRLGEKQNKERIFKICKKHPLFDQIVSNMKFLCETKTDNNNWKMANCLMINQDKDINFNKCKIEIVKSLGNKYHAGLIIGYDRMEKIHEIGKLDFVNEKK